MLKRQFALKYSCFDVYFFNSISLCPLTNISSISASAYIYTSISWIAIMSQLMCNPLNQLSCLKINLLMNNGLEFPGKN